LVLSDMFTIEVALTNFDWTLAYTFLLLFVLIRSDFIIAVGLRSKSFCTNLLSLFVFSSSLPVGTESNDVLSLTHLAEKDPFPNFESFNTSNEDLTLNLFFYTSILFKFLGATFKSPFGITFWLFSTLDLKADLHWFY
jgi:hypothetical protein